MTLSDELYDAYLEDSGRRPFSRRAIKSILRKHLYEVLCHADGELSAIRHGRKPSDDKELESIYYKLRDITDDLERQP